MMGKCVRPKANGEVILVCLVDGAGDDLLAELD